VKRVRPKTGLLPRVKGIYHVGCTDYPNPTYPCHMVLGQRLVDTCGIRRGILYLSLGHSPRDFDAGFVNIP
jgi:hypothetical protein